MSNPAQGQARRRFLKLAALSVVVAPIAATGWPRVGLAADLPHLDLNDPTAKALKYTEDAETAKAEPAFKPGSNCANCQFYQGTAGSEYGPCVLFPGKAVHAKGWCVTWTKKA